MFDCLHAVFLSRISLIIPSQVVETQQNVAFGGAGKVKGTSLFGLFRGFASLEFPVDVFQLLNVLFETDDAVDEGLNNEILGIF